MPEASLYAFPLSFETHEPYLDIRPGRNEVDELNFSSGWSLKESPYASATYYLQAWGPDLEAAVGGEFYGDPGFYDLTVGYFDESDGISWMEIVVNGAVLSKFYWDAPYQEPDLYEWSLWEHKVWAVPLAPGDVIELRGQGDAGEPLRTDYLDVTPSSALAYGETLRIEAEDLERMDFVWGMYVEKNGAASDGVNLRSDGSSEGGISFMPELSGHYDIELGYFDELDGISEITIYKNWEPLAVLSWDGEEGAAIASKASAKTFTLHDVELTDRDWFQVYGRPNGGEPMRLDYLDFTAVEAGSGPPGRRLPDLWYVIDGEIRLTLNRDYAIFDFDQAGDYEGIKTGIEGGPGELVAADYDADGDTDFLRVELADPFPLPPGDGNDYPGAISITATFYENDGDANFEVAETFSATFDLTWSGNGLWDVFSARDVFDFADTADMDGDGDLDFFGFSIAAQAPLVFENQGDNSFELLEPQHPFEEEYSSLSYESNYGFFADLNGDEFLDIVYNASYNLSASFVLINDGQGGFKSTAAIYGGDDGTVHEAVGDLDGDGDNDIAVVGISDGADLFAFINDGSGAWEPGGYPSYEPSYERTIGRIAVGDFDGDGVDEILNAGLQDIYEGIMPGLRVFEYDKASNSLVEKSYDPHFFGHVVETGDFDGDGDLDFIGAHRAVFPSGEDGYASPVLFLNDGTGNFDLTEGRYVTPSFEGEFFWYRPPDVRAGYFDDPYPIA